VPVSASTNKKILTKVLSKINADCSKNKQNVYTLLKDGARPNFSTTSVLMKCFGERLPSPIYPIYQPTSER
jgi:DNA-binding phage protein